MLFCATGAITLSQNPTYQQKLYYTCKAWGFVKYYHSRVSTCQVNWDSVLVSRLPVIKNAASGNDFNNALASMLSAAGPMAITTTPSPDTLPPELKRNLNFGWINDPVFRNDIKLLLDTIKNNFRPHDVCWVSSGAGTGSYLSFPYDDPAIDSNAYTNYPFEFSRVLLLYKYWNIINYFNPYNYVQDVSWDSTLYLNIPAVIGDTDYEAFYKTIKKMASGLNDAHVEGLTYNSTCPFLCIYRPKIILRYTQNKYVVAKSGYDTLSRGDIILSVDGRSPLQWEDSLRLYTSAGNPAVFRRFVCSYMLRGDSGSLAQIEYKDSLGVIRSFSCSRNYPYGTWFSDYTPSDSLATVKWVKWNCNVGYVNMGKLMTSDVYDMYNELKNTTAIIFDIRNYPNGTVIPIANSMYPDYTCFARFTLPVITYPGTCSWYVDFLGWNGNPDYYTGKVIILCNQESQSQAEFTCMALRAMPNSVVVGSQTAGTDGNITKFKLSQDIQTGFTNLGVFYPNGDSTERIGIVPDSLVYITPEGTRYGRDEVLEKALQVSGCLVPFLSITPSVREVTTPAGTTTFAVNSNTNWSAVSDGAWCLVSPGGSGIGIIAVTYEENTSVDLRVCNIMVTAAGGISQTVTIRQTGVLPALAVSPINQYVTASEGSTFFEVTSNTNWLAVSDVAWCAVTLAGSGNGTILADYTQNTSDQPRVANIEITVASLPGQKVTITQARSNIGMEESPGNDAVIYPNPAKDIIMIIPGKADHGNMVITIQDLTGKVLLNKQCKGEKEYRIDLSWAPQGLYNIIINTNTNSLVHKLVIIK
jgi:hypothetical protein